MSSPVATSKTSTSCAPTTPQRVSQTPRTPSRKTRDEFSSPERTSSGISRTPIGYKRSSADNDQLQMAPRRRLNPAASRHRAIPMQSFDRTLFPGQPTFLSTPTLVEVDDFLRESRRMEESLDFASLQTRKEYLTWPLGLIDPFDNIPRCCDVTSTFFGAPFFILAAWHGDIAMIVQLIADTGFEEDSSSFLVEQLCAKDNNQFTIIHHLMELTVEDSLSPMLALRAIRSKLGSAKFAELSLQSPRGYSSFRSYYEEFLARNAHSGIQTWASHVYEFIRHFVPSVIVSEPSESTGLASASAGLASVSAGLASASAGPTFGSTDLASASAGLASASAGPTFESTDLASASAGLASASAGPMFESTSLAFESLEDVISSGSVEVPLPEVDIHTEEVIFNVVLDTALARASSDLADAVDQAALTEAIFHTRLLVMEVAEASADAELFEAEIASSNDDAFHGTIPETEPALPETESALTKAFLSLFE